MHIKLKEENKSVISRIKWASIHRDKPYIPILQEDYNYTKKRFIGLVHEDSFSFFLKRTKTYKDIIFPALFVSGKVDKDILSLRFLPGISTIIIVAAFLSPFILGLDQFDPKVNQNYLGLIGAAILVVTLLIIWVLAERKLIIDRIKKTIYD